MLEPYHFRLDLKIFKNLNVEFFIKQNTTLPIVKMDVVFDGRTDAGEEFYSVLDNATLRFSMISEDTGIPKISMKQAYIVAKDKRNPDAPWEYYIYYKWGAKDTNIKGRFLGQFLVVLESGELISPFRENLYINII
jgi:hypothetical protein